MDLTAELIAEYLRLMVMRVRSEVEADRRRFETLENAGGSLPDLGGVTRSWVPFCEKEEG